MKNLKYSINSENGGINFIVELNNKEYGCLVSQEALQDIDPINRMENIEKQFISNRNILEDIAIDMILNQKKDKIYITSSDIKK